MDGSLTTDKTPTRFEKTVNPYRVKTRLLNVSTRETTTECNVNHPRHQTYKYRGFKYVTLLGVSLS